MSVACVKTYRTFSLGCDVTTMCAPVRGGQSLEDVQARLQEELDARSGNMRRLARDIGGNVESVRRLLYRLLREGASPEPETSALLERGLDKPAGYFTVAVPASRERRDRLAELEAEVAALKANRDDAIRAVTQRLADLEAAQERLEQQLDQQTRAAQ